MGRHASTLALTFAATLSAGLALADPPPARIVTPIDTRDGPGGYFAAGLRLLAGASVKITQERGGWVMAEVGSQRTAWIPRYALDSAQNDVRPGELLRALTKDMLRSVTRMLRSEERRVGKECRL